MLLIFIDLSAIMLPKRRATNFLKVSERTKRSLNGLGDIYFMDECCTSKGCSIHEIKEYCVWPRTMCRTKSFI